MAEAIAAFSLAANIVQFIDFSSNFFSTVWSIHRKGRDGIAVVFDMEKTTKDLQVVLTDIIIPPGSTDGLTESERSLQELAEQCQKLGTELMSGLRQVGSVNKSRKRDALKTAFQLIWKEDELKSQQQRLEGFRSQLTLHLLASLR
jgi:hypothetical protein